MAQPSSRTIRPRKEIKKKQKKKTNLRTKIILSIRNLYMCLGHLGLWSMGSSDQKKL